MQIDAYCIILADPTSQEIEKTTELMMRFAERTGLTGGHHPRRYLWTDAFAVCNFLGLARATGKNGYTALAVRLVDQVHHVLGTYRRDDRRSGWISGLGAEEGEKHPTRGGLRIGKSLPERSASEPLDPRLEWERDGQYFHYLTKWMHALSQVCQWTGDARYGTWARELAKAAHDAFVYADGNGLGMVWKMSTDLSRPLVASMGHHDPLDGFVTCVQLRTTTPARADAPDLEAEEASFARLVEGRDWTTADALGLGGLLVDAARVVQLMHRGALVTTALAESLFVAALRGLRAYVQQGEVGRSASHRLAFRELGLTIGLRAVSRVEDLVQTTGIQLANRSNLDEQIDAVARYTALGREIQSFWLVPEHHETRLWSEHEDINDVMLATSLLPDGFCS